MSNKTTLALVLVLGAGQTAQAANGGPAPVILGSAANYVILTKTGITNVPASDITGNLGTSPINATAITGFSLIADGTNRFSRSSQVTGKIYAADYAAPTPTNLTSAIGDMQRAYTDAAGRSLPDATELYAGNLSGRTLVPGLYKWSSGVLVTSQVTLAGSADAVWIFQIAGDLTFGSGARVVLGGDAQAKNIYWQVGGGTGVEIGTTSHVEGNILAVKAIHLRTGASLNGRALSQTAVTLAKNRLVIPTGSVRVFTSEGSKDGYVLESFTGSTRGGTQNATSSLLRVGDDAGDRQYRGFLHFDTSSLPDGAVVTDATLLVRKQGQVGVNPFTTHGLLQVDIRKPYFGSTSGLQIKDFQASASGWAVATIKNQDVNHWYKANVNAAGRALVNTQGTTQFRLRFSMGDDDDSTADQITFYTGNATAAQRPQLEIRYYVPSGGAGFEAEPGLD
jgi:hypothetical protein